MDVLVEFLGLSIVSSSMLKSAPPKLPRHLFMDKDEKWKEHQVLTALFRLAVAK